MGLLSVRLDRYKRKNDNLYNFRCPYCGDSQKNKYKARGYVYSKQGGLFYKCHNCSVGTNLYQLLEHVDTNLAKQYRLESFTEGKTHKPETTIDFKPPVFGTKKPYLDILSPISGPALQYALDRQLPKAHIDKLFWVEDSQLLEKIDPKYEGRIIGNEPRLVIPFYDIKGNMFALQARAIDNNKLRYITIKINEKHPLVYGLNDVNFTKEIYIFEGPFDSMFIPNSVAVGGSDFNRISRWFSTGTIVFDNQPRNIEIVNKMVELATQHYNIVVWPSYLRSKDINDMILEGFSATKILDIINQNTFTDLSALNSIQNWKRC
jgi:hypothetical protein